VRRLLLFLSALCLLLATAGCSDDDGKDEPEDDQETSTGGLDTPDPDEQLKTKPKTIECDAEVSTTGAYKAEWDGDASVTTGGKTIDDTGPAAVYTLNDDRNGLSLYSPGLAFKGSISMTADGHSYSSDPADAESFDIDPKGKRAEVDATLTSISGDEIQVVAEFTCGKQ
jgi:hypothetical protein